MNKKTEIVRYVISISFLSMILIGIVVIVILLSQAQKLNIQGIQPTQLATQLPVSTTITTQKINSTPTPSQLSYDEAVDLLTTVSREAVVNANRAIDFMKWVVATVFLGLVGTSVTIIIYNDNKLRDTLKALELTRSENTLIQKDLERSTKQLSDLTNKYVQIQITLSQIPKRVLPIEFGMKAYEKGRIKEDEMIESKAWYSWQKWIFGEEDTGYGELIQYKKDPQRLPFIIVLCAITMLTEIEERINIPGQSNNRDLELRDRLKDLLNIDSDRN